MTNPIDTSPVSHVATLVRAEWGAGSTVDYCLYTGDLSVTVPGEGAVSFTARPAMSVEYGEQHGGVRDEPASVFLPSDDALVVLLSEAAPRVEITIAEVDPDDASSYRVMFYGSVGRCILNPSGRVGVAELKIDGLKSRLNVKLGMVAEAECQWRYGKLPCGVDLPALSEASVTIDSVDGRTLTCTDTAVTGRAARYWHRGYVEVDGMRVMVRDWASGSGFSMMDVLPSSWAGASATFVPGCLKTIGWCRDDGPHVATQGSQEEHFSGIGIAMLDYNPQYEKGGG